MRNIAASWTIISAVVLISTSAITGCGIIQSAFTEERVEQKRGGKAIDSPESAQTALSLKSLDDFFEKSKMSELSACTMEHSSCVDQALISYGECMTEGTAELNPGSLDADDKYRELTAKCERERDLDKGSCDRKFSDCKIDATALHTCPVGRDWCGIKYSRGRSTPNCCQENQECKPAPSDSLEAVFDVPFSCQERGISADEANRLECEERGGSWDDYRKDCIEQVLTPMPVSSEPEAFYTPAPEASYTP